MTTTQPIATAARSAARALIADYGPGLEVDVEAALHASAAQQPTQYLDPVSVSSLIVAIATLAWTIYNDQRKHTPNPHLNSSNDTCESKSANTPTPARKKSHE